MDSLSKSDKKRNDELYGLFKKAGLPDAWSKELKEQNYQKLGKIAEYAGLPLDGTSCLDVGCGTGDLSAFLRQGNIEDYLGVDIYEPSLVEARKKHNNERFENLDILGWETDKKFDYAFCSGALSTRLGSDNYEFLEAMVRKMWDLTQIGVSFNFLTDEDPQAEPEIFFYSVDSVMAISKGIAGGNGKVLLEKDTENYQCHVYLHR
jgi:ubiquinone/menaquinone biosynthesis C-methylase UbiE|tara:strand:+ start:101 stop:718 length:618 start_codon:yes stop_codon:yes gene_type:complete